MNVKGHTSKAWTPPIVVPQQESLKSAAALLNAGKKIVILAGQGALGAGDELEQIADTLGAPIVKALLGKAVVPDDSPVHHRRHRPARHAALRAGDGGVRHAADGRHELPLHGVSAQARPGQGRADRPRPDADRPALSRRHRPGRRRQGDARRPCCRCSSAKQDRSFLEKAQERHEGVVGADAHPRGARRRRR